MLMLVIVESTMASSTVDLLGRARSEMDGGTPGARARPPLHLALHDQF